MDIIEENAAAGGTPPPTGPTPAALGIADPLERIIGYLLEYFPLYLLHLFPVFGGIFTTIYVLLRDGLFPGQSVGKKVMSTRVLVRATGMPATFRESVIRNFPLAIGFFISIIPIIGHIVGFFIGLAVLLIELSLVFFDPERRRIGDKLAGTIVVKSPK